MFKIWGKIIFIETSVLIMAFIHKMFFTLTPVKVLSTGQHFEIAIVRIMRQKLAQVLGS